MVSVSSIPGGNPTALADPEGYAISYLDCGSCHTKCCDRCAAKGPTLTAGSPCPKCKSSMAWAGVPIAASKAPAQAAEFSGGAGDPKLGGRIDVVGTLYGIGRELDVSLNAGNQKRAAALGTLAWALVQQHQSSIGPTDLRQLVQFGEQYFRWQLFDDGAQYFKGIYKCAEAAGPGASEILTRAIVLAGSFDYLAGNLDSKPDLAQSVLGMAGKMFDAQHPLNAMLQRRAAQKAHAANAAFGQPTWDMAPRATPAAPAAGGDIQERLALWVTLAFIRLAGADGKVDDREYMAWKAAMQRLNLPDVYGKFGGPACAEMLNQGKLQTLSVELSNLSKESKIGLGTILKEVVVADGRVDHSELVALHQVLSWLGLGLGDIGIEVARR